MEVAEESCEVLSPLSRTRCNTWHAGSEDENTPLAEVDSSLLLAGKGIKRPARRNAWGVASYADLIATAIESSPDKRLTLSQIYDWMVTNVQYFSDKADNPSSAGWKNSIRHNLSLHRRFVRVPHSDGKSAWWTVNPSEPSGVRWPRGSNSTRHRADSMDTRSYVLQRQRRNRKSCPESAADSSRKSNARTVPLPSICSETDEANLDSFKLFNGQNFCASSSDNAVFPSTVDPFNLCNNDTFPPRSVCADINSDLSAAPSEFLITGDHSDPAKVEFSLFHGKLDPLMDPAFDSAAFGEDEYSDVMVTQLSPLPWNPLETGLTELPRTDVGAIISENVSLFSDDSMLAASQQADSSQHDSVFCDNRELMLAAYSTVSPASDLPSFRRGSDAPPPSPESNCGEPSTSFDEAVSNLAEMKVETSHGVDSSTQFATGWTSVFRLKTDDLSSLSDMDMDH